MEKLFHLSEKNTNVRTEIVAGLTTFMTMAYVLAVQPFSICGGAAMAITLISGIVFAALTVFGLRDLIVRIIPKNLKIAISASIMSASS